MIDILNSEYQYWSEFYYPKFKRLGKPGSDLTPFKELVSEKLSAVYQGYNILHPRFHFIDGTFLIYGNFGWVAYFPPWM